MRVVVTTGRRFKAAIIGEEESREDLHQYTVNSNPEEIEVWKEMEQKAQEARLNNPEAMDVYDIDPGQAAVTRSTLQLTLLEDEDEYGTGKGETSWLALGLKLEEAQCVSIHGEQVSRLMKQRLALRTFVRQQGSVLSKAKKLQITTKRQNLDIRLDSFIVQSEQFVNNDTLDALQTLHDQPRTPLPASDTHDYQTDSEHEDNLNNPFITGPAPTILHTAETRPLPLPSTFGFPRISQLGLDSLAEKELKLREGQANDELQGVRMALGEKSFLFRKDVRLAKSKLKKGRAWSKVVGIGRRVQAHRQLYNVSRAAMVSLACPVEMQTKYQVLRREQLRISTAAVRGGTSIGSAEAGSRRQDEPLAWFWTINVQADIAASDMLKECTSTLSNSTT